MVNFDSRCTPLMTSTWFYVSFTLGKMYFLSPDHVSLQKLISSWPLSLLTSCKPRRPMKLVGSIPLTLKTTRRNFMSLPGPRIHFSMASYKSSFSSSSEGSLGAWQLMENYNGKLSSNPQLTDARAQGVNSMTSSFVLPSTINPVSKACFSSWQLW